MNFITNTESLKRSIRKYDLVLVAIESTSGHGECKPLVYMKFARRGSGKRGGRFVNMRQAVLSPQDALPFRGTRKASEPSFWFKKLAERELSAS